MWEDVYSLRLFFVSRARISIVFFFFELRINFDRLLICDVLLLKVIHIFCSYLISVHLNYFGYFPLGPKLFGVKKVLYTPKNRAFLIFLPGLASSSSTGKRLTNHFAGRKLRLPIKKRKEKKLRLDPSPHSIT